METGSASLQDKYKELITAAQTAGVSNLQVRQQDNVLYIDGTAPSGEVKDNLWNIYNKNIRKGPGTDQPVVGKAAHNEVVTVISKANDQWSLIRTDKGEEGYVYTQYITKV